MAALDAEREAPYRRMLLEGAPRLLSQLDREPLSPTWGSFDRDHWAWKFRDFPIILLQTGLLPLTWLYARTFDGNPYAGNAQVLEWIEGCVDSLLDRQHANGAFDTISPNTQDHGVTLSVVYSFATVARELGAQLAPSRLDRMRDAIRRACAFAARSDEDYAFISNHQALFAVAWLRAGLLLQDESLLRRADETVAEILSRQSAEGWYLEYGGADPGYESLGIQYLALFRKDRPSAALDASLTRAVAFYTHFVQLDGSVGGGYGSRDTLLWYPGGFELLAADLPDAAAVARFLRRRLDHGNVVTPRNVDVHNLTTLLTGYAVAADSVAAARDVAPPSPLPCEAPHLLRRFNESGLVVVGTPHYQAVANVRKGGMLVVIDRASGQILHEDAGYVVRARGRDWTTALLGDPTEVAEHDGGVRVTTGFVAANRQVLTPLKFLILRGLNLTAFRSVWLGAIIRRMIIAKMITGRNLGPYRITRRLDFADDHVAVHDELVTDDGAAVTKVWRPRTYQAHHMGSARYFHPRELVSLTTALDEAPDRLAARLRQDGRLVLQFIVASASDSRSAVSGAPDLHASAVSDLTT